MRGLHELIFSKMSRICHFHLSSDFRDCWISFFWTRWTRGCTVCNACSGVHVWQKFNLEIIQSYVHECRVLRGLSSKEMCSLKESLNEVVECPSVGILPFLFPTGLQSVCHERVKIISFYHLWTERKQVGIPLTSVIFVLKKDDISNISISHLFSNKKLKIIKMCIFLFAGQSVEMWLQ